jgi:hypothetical protein
MIRVETSRDEFNGHTNNDDADSRLSVMGGDE